MIDISSLRVDIFFRKHQTHKKWLERSLHMKTYIIDLEKLCNNIILNLHEAGLIGLDSESVEVARGILMFYLSNIEALQL